MQLWLLYESLKVFHSHQGLVANASTWYNVWFGQVEGRQCERKNGHNDDQLQRANSGQPMPSQYGRASQLARNQPEPKLHPWHVYTSNILQLSSSNPTYFFFNIFKAWSPCSKIQWIILAPLRFRAPFPHAPINVKSSPAFGAPMDALKSPPNKDTAFMRSAVWMSNSNNE